AVALLLSLPLQALTQLTASVDKNPALRGEAVTLEVVADAKVAADAINFRALEQNFTVMVPSISSSTQIINGQASQSTRWRVVLLPKTTGEFTIPAFTLQGLSTEPIKLQILAGTATKDNSASQELFLEASLEQQQLYVQQLSYYQVTIYFNGELQRGSLSEPVLDGASISQVGEDADGSELVNGIRYRTITRRYAITPQRSGSFTIAPPTFSGEMIDRDSARYNYFARTKTVVQQAQPIDVSVKAIPDNFPGDWLVAGLVTLTEEWSPDITVLKQGEPVTRIITLSAVDVAENQLPELKQGFPDGLRLYQEQPQAKSAERNGRLVAQKIFTTAVIANKAGELELPAVKLPWWNSQTDKLDYATLPARQLSVSASAATEPTAETPVPATTPATAVQNAVPGTNQTVSPWQWNYLSSLLLALWLLSLFVGYLYWQLKTPAKPAAARESRVRFDSAALKQACQRGDAHLARAELLRFGHQQLDVRCLSLTELKGYLNSAALTQQLDTLNNALYGNSTEQWQGQSLWQAWQQYSAVKSATDTATSLSPLYPQ
ncbi:MAG TPA: BatD family protein, partial [Rheinheimera sp.]|nr:BatD family protein [Rheinheimera sp.]